MVSRRLILERFAGTRPPDDPAAAARPGALGDLPPELRPPPARVRPAAVLVPLVEHMAGFTILLTKRAAHLPEHPGQVSFPGGRIEPGDAGPAAAALRETEEEIGLPASRVEVVGFLDPYLTITGYAVIPVVGFVPPGLTYRLDAYEVAELFELPLDHLLDPGNHRVVSREFFGRTIRYYAIDYKDHHIWGATAAMLMNFYHRLTGTAPQDAGRGD